ncbi:PIG-L family deacetylase [Cohaesibacter celericrescens]|uniref:PIG-L family deacetylase n=1 Tax=Cohaesibacter celericrescens TaxID=2067669 RepID=A0A2N5XRC3_9HYPH|nr:PIG-L family deacetylase [Cohaesibacter celericrescens]PLW77049.1 PIG-L family deacetylase [Cohaesibacter celericrescens]
MPFSDPSRLAAEASQPLVLQLWEALQPLKSVIRFMASGAHPDDEMSAMLVAMALKDGINLSYACANRGEGGQNDIGTETGADLGALRTAEMERAANRLAMRLYWLSVRPDDSIIDFGFSKSGDETLQKWGRTRTLKRFVDIIRSEKPDILCPTFLDVPGQHGHHRAMTELAHVVMTEAANPDFADSGLPVWQVKKLYLPAWSGAGTAYDDDVPPPPATLTISARGFDPISGWSYERIGQQSRMFHKTQGMGRWIPAGSERNFLLHLAQTHVAGPDDCVMAGLPHTLMDLSRFTKDPIFAGHLKQAETEISATIAAFPDMATVVEAASSAYLHVSQALSHCPDAAKTDCLHRLVAKQRQLARVIALASGINIHVRSDEDWVRPGDQLTLTHEIRPPMNGIDFSYQLDLPHGWSVDKSQDQKYTISLSEEAAITDPYRCFHDPDEPIAPAMIVTLSGHGITSKTRHKLEIPPVVLPACSAHLAPVNHVVNLANSDRTLEIELSELHPSDATPSLQMPDGWLLERHAKGFKIQLPEQLSEGLYTLPLSLDGNEAMTIIPIAYDHIAPTARAYPACIQVRVLTAELGSQSDDRLIGYIGGGNDRVGEWMAAIGANVENVDAKALQDPAALARYDCLLVGIFAMRFHPTLSQSMDKIHDWVNQGGTLITLYHRPWDNWNPDQFPPHKLEIGQPSLRWRVTDETAIVTHLEPQHGLLNQPNPIGAEDWQGWHKERGLYFAKHWDESYTPLLSMADPEEDALQGAFLVAPIGKGQHIHTSLILHHQMEKLVPGAFRLMANMVAWRG